MCNSRSKSVGSAVFGQPIDLLAHRGSTDREARMFLEQPEMYLIREPKKDDLLSRTVPFPLAISGRGKLLVEVRTEFLLSSFLCRPNHVEKLPG